MNVKSAQKQTWFWFLFWTPHPMTISWTCEEKQLPYILSSSKHCMYIESIFSSPLYDVDKLLVWFTPRALTFMQTTWKSFPCYCEDWFKVWHVEQKSECLRVSKCWTAHILAHGNYVYRQTDSIALRGFAAAAVIWSWICASGSLHSISLSCPGWTFSIVGVLPKLLKPHTFSDPLKPICTTKKKKKKLGTDLSALVLRRRCWDYSLVRQTTWGQHFTGSGFLKRDVVFLPLITTHTKHTFMKLYTS